MYKFYHFFPNSFPHPTRVGDESERLRGTYLPAECWHDRILTSLSISVFSICETCTMYQYLQSYILENESQSSDTDICPSVGTAKCLALFLI